MRPFVPAAPPDDFDPRALTLLAYTELVHHKDAWFHDPDALQMNTATARGLGHEWGLPDTDENGRRRDWSAPGSSLFGFPIEVDDTIPVGVIKVRGRRAFPMPIVVEVEGESGPRMVVR